MSYSYSGNESTLLRELTSEFVYCPKCGTENNFSSASSTQTSFFCQRCSTKISDYWDRFRNGKMQTVNCELCSQQTFVTLKYCISCGEIKEKAAQVRSEKITEQVKTKRSRFIDNRAKQSFIAGLVFLVVGISLIILSIDSASDIYSITGFILSGLSLIHLIIIPIFAIIITMRKNKI